jgi:hypothetical protein
MTDIPDRARLAFRIQVEESWPTTRAERSTLRAARVQQASGQSVPFRLHGTRELKHRLPRLRRFASNFSDDNDLLAEGGEFELVLRF